MDCPRCGTRLTRISLNGELQSVYCEQCRFADVESDHTRASERGETWDDALQRFRTMHAVEEQGDSAAEDGGEDGEKTDGEAESEYGEKTDDEADSDTDEVDEADSDTDELSNADADGDGETTVPGDDDGSEPFEDDTDAADETVADESAAEAVEAVEDDDTEAA